MIPRDFAKRWSHGEGSGYQGEGTRLSIRTEEIIQVGRCNVIEALACHQKYFVDYILCSIESQWCSEGQVKCNHNFYVCHSLA